jgi:hypothetical protein
MDNPEVATALRTIYHEATGLSQIERDRVSSAISVIEDAFKSDDEPEPGDYVGASAVVVAPKMTPTRRLETVLRALIYVMTQHGSDHEAFDDLAQEDHIVVNNGFVFSDIDGNMYELALRHL